MSHYHRMKTRLHLAIALTLVVGCSSSDGPPGPSANSPGGGGGSASGGASQGPGGSVSATGGTGAQNGAGGAAQGGAASGGISSTAGGASSGAGGTLPNAGGTSPSTGGAVSSAGGAAAGGAGGCVKNLKCTPAVHPTTGDLHQDCVDRINQFRTECACLPALARWKDGEACADQMSQYDSEKNTAHAGFQAKICSGGSAQDECPAYSSNDQVISRCLQQMWNEGPPPQATCTGACFQMYGHFINMSSTTSTKVACGFYTMPTGKIWAAQNFSR
jgi:hypothetical protein